MKNSEDPELQAQFDGMFILHNALGKCTDLVFLLGLIKRGKTDKTKGLAGSDTPSTTSKTVGAVGAIGDGRGVKDSKNTLSNAPAATATSNTK